MMWIRLRRSKEVLSKIGTSEDVVGVITNAISAPRSSPAAAWSPAIAGTKQEGQASKNSDCFCCNITDFHILI